MKNKIAIKKRIALLEYIFYGNYFYGLCTIALSVEASLQQLYPLNPLPYYLLAFIVTVLYYTYPYARKQTISSNNPRTRWYNRHFKLISITQMTATIILAIAAAWFLIHYYYLLHRVKLFEWMLIFIFPLVAALYYGINVLSVKYNLRKIGWLKPFIIGFTWAGFVNVYPVLYYCITNNTSYEPNFFSFLLFLKNMMFIAVLCIMFDIKDYASDSNDSISTFVVRIGLRKTIFFVLLPLSLLGLFTFWGYAFTHQFLAGKILLNTIPFVLLIATCYSLRKRRALLYYLIIIDGLMLVKAICGTFAMIYF